MNKDPKEASSRLTASIDADVLTPHVSEEDIEREIRDEGGDSDAIAERGRKLAQGLLAQRRVPDMRVMSNAAIRAARAVPSARLQLLRDRIEAGRADARFAAILAAQETSLADATEEQLWELVEKLERLKSEPIPG